MKGLNITRKIFDALYPNISASIFTNPAVSRDDLITRQLTSKLWRMNNLYTIVNKDGDRVKFRMNIAQHMVYAAYLKHPRLIILKSRQQGISTFWLIFYFDSAVFGDDLTEGLMAQGKAEAGTLLKRVKIAWEALDQNIKDFLGIRLTKDNMEEFSFSNGSTIFIRTSFRSATLQGLHISEFGKIANKYPERAKETKTGTMQAIKPGLPVAIESTAEGDNDFKAMWDTAWDRYLMGEKITGKDFMPVFLSWLDDPDCVNSEPQTITLDQSEYFARLEAETNRTITDQQKWFWIAQYRELGDDIYQEYPATPEEAFTVTKDGTYYSRLYREWVVRKRRELTNLWDKNLPVHVAMDLGMNDTFVVGFFQVWENEVRIIDEYYNSGEGLAHYVELIASRPYEIGEVLVPHDVRVKELSTGKSRLHRLRELGVKNIKVLPKIAINDGIEAVRKMIPNLWIDSSCGQTIRSFKNYSKEWDDKHSVWKNKPLHNEHSHGADMVRYIAVGKPAPKLLIQQRQPERGSIADGLAL